METRKTTEPTIDGTPREEWFAAAVETYAEPLYWHIRRMVVRHDEAQDLLQEMWLRAWRSIGSLRGGNGELRPWLYAIATNLCLSRLKRKYMWQLVPLEDVGRKLSESLEASTDLDPDSIEVRFQKALLALPTKQRLVFNLRYYDELPYAEISRITGMSENTLKTDYHYAQKRIRELMTL
ncbi:MAG TPA: RNA polymerase sigma factor [Candidatus Alistipes excrementipullorum]|nr:RNA polymerase sigma factor [Candidatus Alistipes excrementipullorum]